MKKNDIPDGASKYIEKEEKISITYMNINVFMTNLKSIKITSKIFILEGLLKIMV